MKGYYVQDVFESIKSGFLEKVRDYHDETGRPIYVSIRVKKPPCCPDEKQLLQNMQTYLRGYNLELVGQYLPLTTHKKARETHIRTQYYNYKLKIAFIEDAIQQIGGYDPFYITMDDIHETDMLLMELINRQMYYKEKMMN